LTSMVGKLRVLAILLSFAATPLFVSSSSAFNPKDGNDCTNASDQDRGIEACTRIINSKGEKPVDLEHAHTLRGLRWENKNDYERAKSDFTEAIRLNPKDFWPYLDLGNILLNTGDVDGAIANYNAVLRMNPRNALALSNRCAAFDRKAENEDSLNKIEPARKDCDEAIKIDPKYAGAYINRAEGYSYLGQFDKALPDLDLAIKLNPKYADSYRNRGYVEDQQGRFDVAISDYDQAISLDPKSSRAYLGRADTWSHKGEFDRALADYGDAIKLSPKDDVPYNDRGLVWIQRGDLEQAMKSFDEGIQVAPNDFKLYTNRSKVWRLKGNLDRALADQDTAIKLRSSAPIVWVERADTLRYKGDYQAALETYSKALSINPGSIVSLTGRGLTYEKMGDLPRARAEYEKAVSAPSQYKVDENEEARETARARLAAFDSGAPQPTIPAAPAEVTSATSIPTPAISQNISATIPTAANDRRIALIIGNSIYQNANTLSNPLVNDATRERLINALKAFGDEAEGADWAVVYYAGHGIQVGGLNYLIPVDAKLATDRDVQFETVALDQVLSAVDQTKKLRIVILDACRDNPFIPQMRRTELPEAVERVDTSGKPIATRSIGHGLGKVEVSGATLVVYSAKDGQTALDGEGDDSPFAIALAERLATPGIEISKLLRLIRDDVLEATAGRQEPYTYGSLPGKEDFFFIAPSGFTH
jgi:tetratricopeptide (TPR) repeat protein